MAAPFDGLKPELIWKHFEAFTRIPRCSANEAAAAEHVVAWAEKKGYKALRDQTGNVLVRVPASPGKGGASTVVLQGHLDMVGEKDKSSPHDFDKDPIPVVRKGEHLGAQGTTLGADNAIGLAAAMAVAEDPGATHGPLELLFTIEEETGLTGARGLKPGFAKGKILLNLDSEELGSLYVGCAGGADTVVELPVKRAAGKGKPYRVRVSGLKGGHSGLDINTGRGNALKLTALFLDRLRAVASFGLCELAGGDKHNAIPREAEAVVLLEDAALKSANKLLKGFREDLRTVYGKSDAGVSVELERAKTTARPLSKGSRDAVVDLLLALPHGVLGMSQAVAGLVETSTNLAVVRLEKAGLHVLLSSRSSVMPILRATQAGILAMARQMGARGIDKGGYPGWQPDMDSAVLKRAKAVHSRILGKPAEVKAIHAGLECGIIGERFGGMDMISFGPTIEWPHSPSERVHIGSVGRFYDFLKALLADLAG
jgi:dipeptidase D